MQQQLESDLSTLRRLRQIRYILKIQIRDVFGITEKGEEEIGSCPPKEHWAVSMCCPIYFRGTLMMP